MGRQGRRGEAELCIGVLMLLMAASAGGATDRSEVADLIARMAAAYAAVEDYQTLTEVRNFKDGASVEIQRFLYSFRKPNHIRLDFETPHPGMVLIYPDRAGKVLVRFARLGRFFPLHLSPDNPRLLISGDQRIDQTDMGLLIANIARSLTDERRGKTAITEGGETVRITVPALNHFRKNMVTLYSFEIGKATYLPVKVEERTPEGRPERTVVFENLKINTGLSDRFMQGE